MTHTFAGDSQALIGKSGSVSCGVTAPFSWVLYVQGFIVPFMSLFPCGFSVLWTDPQVVTSVVGPRILQQCKNFFGIIVLVCGSSTQWLYSGANGDLLQEDLRCVFQVCCSQNPCPCGRSLLTCASTGDTQTLKAGSGSVSYGGHCSFSSVPVHTRFCLCPPRVSGQSEA